MTYKIPCAHCCLIIRIESDTLCIGDEPMIKCNLSRLMGEQKHSLQDVHRATGISRSTLTRLYYETNDAIHYETLNKLCQFYGCDLGELLEWAPDSEVAR